MPLESGSSRIMNDMAGMLDTMTVRA